MHQDENLEAQPITKARFLKVLDHAQLSPDDVGHLTAAAATETGFWTPTPRSLLRFLKAHFLAAGVVALTAGTIFFVAANWGVLSGSTRLLVVGGAIFALSLTSLRLSLSTAGGRAALALAGLLIGPLLAVYGQVYQTGADAYELFLGWALLLTPFALLVRWPALFIVQVVLLEVSLGFAASQRFGLDVGEDWQVNYALGGLNLLFLAAVEVYHRRAKLRSRINARVFATVAYLFTTLPLLVLVSDRSLSSALRRDDFWLLAGSAIVVSVGYLVFYHRKPRDIFPLSLVAGAGVWFVAAVLESTRPFDSRYADQVFIGAFILLSSLGAAMYLRRLYVSDDDDPEEDEDKFSLARLLKRTVEPLSVADFFSRAGVALRENRVLDALQVPPEFPLSVRILMGLGIWVGSVFLVAVFKLTGIFDWPSAMQLVLAVLCFFGAAVVSRTTWGDVRVHLTVVAVVFGEVLLIRVFEHVDHFPFMFAAIQLLIITVVSNPLTRFFASLSMLLAMDIGFVDWLGRDSWTPGYSAAAILSLALVAFSFRDQLLRLRMTRRAFRPMVFAFSGYGLVMLFLSAHIPEMMRHRASLGALIVPLIVAVGLVAVRSRKLEARGEPLPKTNLDAWLAVVMVLVIVVAGVTQPIAGLALGMMAIGHLVRERLLYLLGAGAAAAELIFWYYELSATLLTKSGLLIALGAVMLIARWVLQRAFDTQDEIVSREPDAESRGTSADGSVAIPAVVSPDRSYRGWFTGPRPVAAVCLATALALFVPAGLAVHKELIVKGGQTVVLELRPSDPRSLMQGDYMTLRYDIAGNARTAASGAYGCVPDRLPLLVDHTTRVAKVDTRACASGPLPGHDQIDVKYHWSNHAQRVTFAPRTYFFAEGQGRTYARARFAEFKVSPKGTMVLTNLLDEQRARIVDRTLPRKN